MTSEEGVYQGAGDAGQQAGSGMGGSGMGSGMNEPAAWPYTAEQAKRGWWPSLLAAAGSAATVIGAVLLARRRSKRTGLMAAMPAPIAEASEQMMRSRGNGSSRSPFRTFLAVALFALAGWGIRRTMAHQG